jgi:pimeloyl-ACP methyl ester carboxylesterase
MGGAPAGPPFALVHGGCEASWVWDDVRGLLGRPVIVVDLAGRDGDPANFGSITLGHWVADLRAALDMAGAGRAIIVSHSLGGITATEFAVSYPERVAALVYISAIVPADGQSMAEALAGQRAETLFAADGGFWPGEREALCWSLFNGDAELGAAVLDRAIPEPAGPLRTPVRTARLPNVPLWYVRLGEDHGLPPRSQTQMIANLPWRATVVDVEGAPHQVMNSDAAGTAAILRQIAESL